MRRNCVGAAAGAEVCGRIPSAGSAAWAAVTRTYRRSSAGRKAGGRSSNASSSSSARSSPPYSARRSSPPRSCFTRSRRGRRRRRRREPASGARTRPRVHPRPGSRAHGDSGGAAREVTPWRPPRSSPPGESRGPRPGDSPPPPRSKTAPANSARIP